MKQLNRMEMAIVKRTAKNTQSLRTKRDKIAKLLSEKQQEFQTIVDTIEKFEAPIREMTGGYSSEEVLNNSFEKVSEESEDSVEKVSEQEENINEIFN